jgi:hypothetical protein
VRLQGSCEIRSVAVELIGEEANLLEQQEAGLAIRDPQAIYSSPSEWVRVRSRLAEVSMPEPA